MTWVAASFMFSPMSHLVVLTTKQRQYLKSAAHHLKPVIQIGKGGITPALIAELDAALTAQELVKIKVNNNSPAHAQASIAPTDKASVVSTLCRELPGAQHVWTIGHTLVLFRQAKDGTSRYKLPRAPRAVMPPAPVPVIAAPAPAASNPSESPSPDSRE